VLRISLASTLTALLFVAGLSAAQPAASAVEAPQPTVVESSSATASVPDETTPLVAEPAPQAPLSKRSYSISPDRPGLNVTFSAELMATALVSNRITRRFISYPSPGLKLSTSFPMFGQHVFIDGETRELAGSATLPCNSYIQNFGKCTPSGNVPRFNAREWITEERGGVRIGQSPVYVGIATFYSETNFGFPDMLGMGVGAEVRPNYSKPMSVFGRLYYYSNLTNEDNYVDPGSALPVTLRYGMARYELGFSKKLGKSRQMLQFGLDGSSTWRLVNAPVNMTKIKLFAASGVRF
jgi:hypothetical protein